MSEHDNTSLRPIAGEDLEKVLEWRNSSRIRSVMFNDHIITMEAHLEWFKRISSDNSALCFIFEAGGRPVGVVNFTNIDRRNSRCHWGFYIGDKAAPRGSGTMMGYLAVEYVFEALKIRKLCGEILESNAQSVKFHKKLGFVEEGLLKRHVLKNGIYEDVLIMALFYEEWEIARGRLENFKRIGG